MGFQDRSPEPPPISCYGREAGDTSSVLTAKVMRLRGFSSSTRARRTRNSHIAYNERSLFTPSEADLIESAREDILFRRRYSDENKKRLGLVCFVVMVLTVFFPPIGLLALYERFDSTISWYCHGEIHCFTPKQRAVLKRQLLMQAIMYPILIIVLAVYYSVVV